VVYEDVIGTGKCDAVTSGIGDIQAADRDIADAAG